MCLSLRDRSLLVYNRPMSKKSGKTIKNSYLQKFRRHQSQYTILVEKLSKNQLSQKTDINGWTVRQLGWFMANDNLALAKRIADLKQGRRFQLPLWLDKLLMNYLTRWTAKQYNGKQLLAKYNLCFKALISEINQLENKDLKNQKILIILDNQLEVYKYYLVVLKNY